MDDASPDERWLPIPGWEDSYEVSDYGRVRSLDRTVTSVRGIDRFFPGRSIQGYRRRSRKDYRWVITLSAGGRVEKHYVSNLVLLAFVGPRPHANWQGRHLDGDTDNNVLTNLAWGTPSQNAEDTIRHGRNVFSNRTHCPREHPLERPNLCPSKKGGHRECLACNRAGSVVRSSRRKGQHVDFVAESHRQYESLLASPGRRQGGVVGELSAAAVMTEATVRALRRDHAAEAGTAELVARYGVKKSQVWNITARRSWKHVV